MAHFIQYKHEQIIENEILWCCLQILDTKWYTTFKDTKTTAC